MKLPNKEFKGPRTDGLQDVIFSRIAINLPYAFYKRSDGEHEVVTLRFTKGAVREINGKQIIYKEGWSYPKGNSWGQGLFYHSRNFDLAKTYYDEAVTMAVEV